MILRAGFSKLFQETGFISAATQTANQAKITPPYIEQGNIGPYFLVLLVKALSWTSKSLA